MRVVFILGPLFLVIGAAVGCGVPCGDTRTCGPGANAGGSTSEGGNGSGGTVAGTGGDSSGGSGGGSSVGGAGGAGGSAPPPAVAAGSSHSCAVVNGSVSCWGANSHGQLGVAASGPSSSPVAVAGLTEVVAVEAGDVHTCALKADGTVWCWGGNSSGQAGNGSTSTSVGPVKVLTVSNAVQIALGKFHGCARLDDGTAVCWGSNGFGELGDGSSLPYSASPVAVGLSNIEYLSPSNGTCAVVTGGGVSCWGEAAGASPSQVAGIADGREVCRGDGHTCVLRESGEVWCWGDNDEWEVGFENGAQGEPLPVAAPTSPVDGISTAATIACGHDHNCAVIGDTTARCWGLGEALGHGMSEVVEAEKWTPQVVAGLESVVAIRGGGHHTCAVTSGHEVYCWGRNDSGQTGQPLTEAAIVQPQLVTGL